MNYTPFIEKAKQIYKNEPTGHDFSHIERVIDFSKKIYQQEGGNWDIIYISALFHDVHRVLSNKENRYITPQESIGVVKSILEDFKLDNDLLEKVLYIIKEHDNKKGDSSIMLELQIVQDADLLDSIGETGLKRTLKYCESKNIPLYDKRFPLDCKDYIPNINPISAIHYVYRTILPKINLLNTKAGKTMAKPETKMLKNFIKKYVHH